MYPTNRPHYGRAVKTLWTNEPVHVLDKALLKDVTDVFLLVLKSGKFDIVQEESATVSSTSVVLCIYHNTLRRGLISCLSLYEVFPEPETELSKVSTHVFFYPLLIIFEICDCILPCNGNLLRYVHGK